MPAYRWYQTAGVNSQDTIYVFGGYVPSAGTASSELWRIATRAGSPDRLMWTLLAGTSNTVV
jgi:hypothetical protein